jgi:hypothetical protein
MGPIKIDKAGILKKGKFSQNLHDYYISEDEKSIEVALKAV